MYMSKKVYSEVLVFSLGVRGQRVPDEVTDGSLSQPVVEMLYAKETSVDGIVSACVDTILGLLDLLYEDTKSMTEKEIKDALRLYQQYQQNPEPYADKPGFAILAEYEKVMLMPGRRNRDKRATIANKSVYDVPPEIKHMGRLAIKQADKTISEHPFYKMLVSMGNIYLHKMKQELYHFLYSDALLFVVALPYLCDELKYDKTRRVTARRVLNIMEPTFALARMLNENKLSQGTTT
jgi:hypothetical protein